MTKNIIIILLAAAALCSCDMDREPQGQIPDTEALVTAKDYERFSIGLHSIARVVTSGDYVILSDIQLDDFNAILGNGNRRMEFYNGQVQPSTGEVASIYSGYYSMIAQCNYLLGHAKMVLSDKPTSNGDQLAIQRAAGQAYFFRAFCYSSLADRFCQSYIHCDKREELGTGLSLQLTYAPTADNSKYPGRSSLADTYDQIVNDLQTSIKLLENYEQTTAKEPGTDKAYVSSDAAKALLARVYLNMGEYELAAKNAEALTGTGGVSRYPLISNDKNFYNMWRQDTGSEIIWLVSGDYSYHGAATGEAFCNNGQNPDYVPNDAAIMLFEVDDTRWYAWFENDDVTNNAAKQKTIKTSSGTADMFQFAKYPGNPVLQESSSTGSNFTNLMKPLRIGEMYLIAAEAYFMLNNESQAKDRLRSMAVARKSGRYSDSLSGTNLLNEIRDERHRELMGEGLRQADLKRWNIGCTRSDAFEGNNIVTIPAYRNLSYEAGDYRLTWPIPQHEIDINPKLQGQQNPGYDTVE